jgi:adenylate cyclase
VVEDIITALTRFPALFVIARNSSFAYKGRSVDIRQVGRELGVRYVLEAARGRSRTGCASPGQLIEAATGAHSGRIASTASCPTSSSCRTR